MREESRVKSQDKRQKTKDKIQIGTRNKHINSTNIMENIATKSFLLLCYHTYLGDVNKSYTWRHVQTGKPYAVISASQPHMRTNEKYKFQYRLFIDAIRTMHCQAVSLLGGFVETDFLNRIDCRDELSVFIRDISLTDAINLGIKYHQDFILYSDGKSAPANLSSG